MGDRRLNEPTQPSEPNQFPDDRKMVSDFHAELRRTLLDYFTYSNHGAPADATDQALAAITAAVLRMLPERITVDVGLNPYTEGWNLAISAIESTIKGETDGK